MIAPLAERSPVDRDARISWSPLRSSRIATVAGAKQRNAVTRAWLLRRAIKPGARFASVVARATFHGSSTRIHAELRLVAFQGEPQSAGGLAEIDRS